MQLSSLPIRRSLFAALLFAAGFAIVPTLLVRGEPADGGSPVGSEEFVVPAMTPQRTDVLPFQYVDEPEVPFYPPGGARDSDGRVWPMQLPLAPEESLKHIVTPVGFSVELFAAEPEIVKPVCMAWDERGRLWVGETQDYPNRLQPDNRGADCIKICEDTDGDGRADRFTVFADGLSIPTSIAFYRGGAIVQNGTETLYLKDTNGDDRADQRHVLISGWSMGDTHGGVSNFQYGLDNWIWAMQGYNPSQPVVAGRPHPNPFRMGFFRFRPDGSQLEFLRSTNNNTWGLGISEEGLIFGSTANRNPSVYLPIPNRYYERVRGWSAEQLGTIADTHLFRPITDRIRQVDHHGGYTSGAGHALYTARRYPAQYWNRTAFVCGPTGKLVGTFLLKPQGADFRSTSPVNLMASDDEWTAPIMAEVGPDGNVWVLDWYNYIVQHNPTPAGFKTGKGNAYETRLRDKRHGRIYRVVHAAAAESTDQPFSLADASPQELVAALRHPTMLWRKHAQRLLVERGQRDVVPALVELVQDRGVDRIGLNVGAIHALWTLHGLGALDEGAANAMAYEAAAEALDHPSAGVRRNAIAVLPRSERTSATILDRQLLADADAQVRLAALLALSEMPPSARAGRAVAEFLTVPENVADRWLPDAAVSAAAAHDRDFLLAVAGETTARPSGKLREAVAVVSQHYARGGPAESVADLITSLLDADPLIAGAVVEALAAGWPKGVPADAQAIAAEDWAAMLDKLPSGSKGHWVRLAALWGNESLNAYTTEIVRSLLATVADEGSGDAARADAARQVIEFQPDNAEVVGELVAQIAPRTSPALASGIIAAVGSGRSSAAGPVLVDAFAGFTPAVKVVAIGVLLSRADWTRSLLDGIEQGAVQLSDLSLDQKQALAVHPDRSIAQRTKQMLDRGGGLPSPDRQQVLEQLLPLAERAGDVDAGQKVFKDQCGKCHLFRGEGIAIGPDLTGMTVHPKHEWLTHTIDPSRSVEGNYRVYSVVTVDGRVLSGLLASETGTSIEMFDAEGKRHVVLREDIDELVASPKSLMPEGFEKQVSETDIANLLEYVTTRGRFTPLDLRKVATVVTTRGMFNDEASATERLIFADWSPKTFAGVPFHLVDPQGDRLPNAVMLYSPSGKLPPRMPRQVPLTVNQPAAAIHLLSGVGGWSAKQPRDDGSVSMTVRLHYRDGQTEDHPLRDGHHFADYIGHFEVPGSQLAFRLRNQQIRYLAIRPGRADPISHLELRKGSDRTAPIVMAITVEARE
ncbi:MAG: c-type cytochrome [Pirellulaceae bacterium]|nr:c-type cytochrome [Pirellulaceae bacterium]